MEHLKEYKEYIRVGSAFLKPVSSFETKSSQMQGVSNIVQIIRDLDEEDVSISVPDRELSYEEFMRGFVAINPDDPTDKWYINAEYVEKNFKEKPDLSISTSVDFYNDGRIEASSISIRNTFDFGAALHHLKGGERVQRRGWNGKGMYLYLHKSARGMTPWIKQPKDFYESVTVDFEPFIVMYTAQGKHQPGWLASQADMLAEDWQLYNDDM